MKIIDFIVCDDIRREVGNKRTIVGAYNERIIFAASTNFKWPVNKQLGFYFRLEREETDPDFDNFLLAIYLNEENDALGKVRGNIKIHDFSRPMVIDIVFPVINFKAPGIMRVKMDFLKGEQVVINNLPEKTFEVFLQDEFEVPSDQIKH